MHPGLQFLFIFSIGPQIGFGMEIYFVFHLMKHFNHLFGQCWKKWIMSKSWSTKH